MRRVDEAGTHLCVAVAKTDVLASQRGFIPGLFDGVGGRMMALARTSSNSESPEPGNTATVRTRASGSPHICTPSAVRMPSVLTCLKT